MHTYIHTYIHTHQIQDATQRFYIWPPELSTYVHLERINLSGNFLTTVPPTVSNLTNLRELDLEQNRLRNLPLELAFCFKLEHIMVLRNPDLSIPSREVTSKGSAAIIKFLKCLYSAQQHGRILFTDSTYRHVPTEVFTFINVTELSVARNAIEIIPPEIADLVNLTHLDMDNNQLVMLPDELCSLTNLRKLSFVNNLLVALPDQITQLLQLQDLRSHTNFLFDAPREVFKHGPWFMLEYHLEVKWGRMSGTLDLSDFQLLQFPEEVMTIDRPPKWGKDSIDRFVRVFAEDLHRVRKKLTQQRNVEKRRAEREAAGLDPDSMSVFDDQDASWNALEEFCDDACIDLGTVVERDRHMLTTMDMVYDSFTLWYAFALGYNSAEEMEQGRDGDEDVRMKPGDVDLYDYIVTRFGPPELEMPCR
jgi:hypothetical protein